MRRNLASSDCGGNLVCVVALNSGHGLLDGFTVFGSAQWNSDLEIKSSDP